MEDGKVASLTSELKFSPDELSEMIETDRKGRVEAALMEIEEVLKKHNCRLEMAITIKGDGRIVPDLAVFPN